MTTTNTRKKVSPAECKKDGHKQSIITLVAFLSALAFTGVAVMYAHNTKASEDSVPYTANQVVLVESTDEDGTGVYQGFIEWVSNTASSTVKMTQHTFRVFQVKLSDVADKAEELEAADKAAVEEGLTTEELNAEDISTSENEVLPEVKINPTVSGN